MIPPETRYADSGGVSIAYQVLGEGPLDLVVVPGFVSNLDANWEEPNVERFYRRLASFSRTRARLRRFQTTMGGQEEATTRGAVRAESEPSLRDALQSRLPTRTLIAFANGANPAACATFSARS